MELSHTHSWQGGLTMSFSNYGRLRPQVRFLQRQFLQDGKLSFTDVLSERTVEQALKALNFAWLDRVYSPLITLWVPIASPCGLRCRLRPRSIGTTFRLALLPSFTRTAIQLRCRFWLPTPEAWLHQVIPRGTAPNHPRLKHRHHLDAD